MTARHPDDLDLAGCVMCRLAGRLARDRVEAIHDADYPRAIAANRLLRLLEGEVPR